jgi:hypothetical protein
MAVGPKVKKGAPRGAKPAKRAKPMKPLKAMGGKMAKGYAKGGAKMSVAGLRAAARKMGYKITKG